MPQQESRLRCSAGKSAGMTFQEISIEGAEVLAGVGELFEHASAILQS
jgi:hypothetical protein